jgi:hypothetical protein
MRKLLIGGLAALTCVAGVVAPATEAAARDRHYYRYHRHHDDDGAAIAAGIAGLAIGAALASSGNRRGYYDDGYRYDRRYRYYDRGYYGRPYGYYERPGYYAYNRGYDRCRTTTRWDPWADTYVQRTRCW